MEYEEVDHLVQLDSGWICSNIAEEAFEDALSVDVDIGLLIGQIFKKRIYEIRQTFDKIALKKRSRF